MRTRLTLDVDEYARYVIARYYRPIEGVKIRTRCTRAQVRQFAQAAWRLAVREQAEEILDARGKAVARRLQMLAAAVPGVEHLRAPREKQRSLVW